MQEQSDLIGNTISRLDAEKISAIDNEIKKLEGSMSGAARSLTAELAPAITDGLTVATATIVEARKQYESLKNVSLKAAAMEALDTAFQPFGISLAEAVGTSAQIAENISKTAEQLQTIRSIDSKGGGGGLGSDLLNSLSTERDLFGKSDRERQIIASGATGADLDTLTEVAQELDALEQMRERGLALERTAASLLEDTLTPLDMHRKKLEELNAIRELGLVTDIEHAKIAEQLKKGFIASQRIAETVKSDPLQESAQDRMRDMSPMQRLNDGLAAITKEFLAGFLTEDQLDLADLLARREFEQAQPQDEAVSGNPRAAALERGSAAAFSSSFGPVAKPMDKVAQLTEQILEVQRRIETALTGETDTLGP